MGDSTIKKGHRRVDVAAVRDAAIAAMEPRAVALLDRYDLATVVAISAAISLKRIADKG